VIFEQNTVKLTFVHTKMAIKDQDLSKVNVAHLKKLEADFIQKTKHSLDTPLPSEFFVPLAAKVLGRNFNLAEKEVLINWKESN
jgi:hypothetical protein